MALSLTHIVVLGTFVALIALVVVVVIAFMGRGK